MRTPGVPHLPRLSVVLYLLAAMLSVPAWGATLAGYWNLNEGAGSTAADSSGSGNNGALINSPLWITGIIGDALEFPSGASAYVAVPPGTSLANLYTNGMTVAAWIKPHSSGGAGLGRIVDKDNNN